LNTFKAPNICLTLATLSYFLQVVKPEAGNDPYFCRDFVNTDTLNNRTTQISARKTLIKLSVIVQYL